MSISRTVTVRKIQEIHPGILSRLSQQGAPPGAPLCCFPVFPALNCSRAKRAGEVMKYFPLPRGLSRLSPTSPARSRLRVSRLWHSLQLPAWIGSTSPACWRWLARLSPGFVAFDVFIYLESLEYARILAFNVFLKGNRT